MIDFKIAKKIVEEYIQLPDWNEPIIILDDLTIETHYGWVFFYNSKTYIETRDIMYQLCGNLPIFIDKSTSQLHPLLLQEAENIEDAVMRLEKKLCCELKK